jgi:hypothetical protein
VISYHNYPLILPERKRSASARRSNRAQAKRQREEVKNHIEKPAGFPKNRPVFTKNLVKPAGFYQKPASFSAHSPRPVAYGRKGKKKIGEKSQV